MRARWVQDDPRRLSSTATTTSSSTAIYSTGQTSKTTPRHSPSRPGTPLALDLYYVQQYQDSAPPHPSRVQTKPNLLQAVRDERVRRPDLSLARNAPSRPEPNLARKSAPSNWSDDPLQRTRPRGCGAWRVAAGTSIQHCCARSRVHHRVSRREHSVETRPARVLISSSRPSSSVTSVDREK
ncbi:hypothetical protein EXIGLDRAFT_139179 [Exidia glandulosa HHB12029]|uniref:Uncharacterized protein n=1 Tax=Exidia glandulosa HHB12029 TaxID=1314781 RepID=A0A165FZ75_EXIGL|nr:hypothetical protein EXIGLDRAFT_139179 [Exidia glandulosa HHB12029]